MDEKRTVMNAPPPFPQSAQYKKDDDDYAQSTAEGETGKPCKQKKKKRVKKAKKRCPAQVNKTPKVAEEPAASVFVPAKSDETYSPFRYAELRKHFVDDKMSTGLSWKDAQAEWNNSDLKRQLLSTVDLPELKKRRFVSKDCTKNPWAS